MPAKEFKFISPGVFINEIDNSQLTSAPGDVGPVIIGRATIEAMINEEKNHILYLVI